MACEKTGTNVHHWLDKKLEPVDRCYTTFAEIMNKSGNYYIRERVSFPRWDEVLDAADRIRDY